MLKAAFYPNPTASVILNRCLQATVDLRRSQISESRNRNVYILRHSGSRTQQTLQCINVLLRPKRNHRALLQPSFYKLGGCPSDSRTKSIEVYGGS